MKRIGIFFILFFLSFIAKAQLNLDFHLKWKPLDTLQIKNGLKTEKFYYLSFEGVQFKNAYFVPLFVKVFPVTYYAKADVKILSINFTRLSTENDLLGKDQLPEKIQVQAEIYLSQKQPFLRISFIPAKKVNNQIYLVTDINLQIDLTPEKLSTKKFAATSVMASGKWVKIAIPQNGVYKISFDRLREMGFSDPTKVRVFGNDFGQLPYYNNQYAPDDLIENSIYVGNDYILFYAKGVKRWYYSTSSQMFERVTHDYSDTAYYFLSDVNTGFNNRIQFINEENNQVNFETDSYIWYGDYELDLYNFLHSGRLWFGTKFYYSSRRNFQFEVDNILEDKVGKLKVVFLGRSYVNTSVTVSVGEYSKTVSIPNITGILGTDWGKIVTAYMNFNSNVTSDLIVSVKYNGVISSSRGYLDYIVVNIPRKLTYQGLTEFRSLESVGTDKVTRFTIHNSPSDLIVWDITDPTRPKQMKLNFNSSAAWFVARTDSLREFVAFTLNDVMEPIYEGKFLGPVQNQNLHATDPQTDMIIISYPDFLPAAKRIAQLHQEIDGLKVVTVTTEQIYNEYSSGIPDAVAIRNYIRSVYLKKSSQLRWILLLGDGSFKNKYGPNNCNFIPTYQTYNSLNTGGLLSLVSDDFFGLLDVNEGETDGFLDVHIGRLPVKNLDEAMAAARKIEYYLKFQDKGSWKSYLVFIADDASRNMFMSDAESVSNKLYQNYPAFRIKKIYIDAYKADVNFGGQEFPAAVSDILNRVENGSLLFSYLGHGNEEVLTSERVITISDVRNWENLNRLNFFITGTCEFGRFDLYQANEVEVTGGEELILNHQGGSIGLLTTTRLSWSSVNAYMNQGIFENAFHRQDGRRLTFGEIITITKRQIANYYTREFVLLGDPALTINYPENYVITTYISKDTIKALSKVTIKGQILDKEMNPMNDFNGILNVTIFDKPQYYWTYDNDQVSGQFKYKDYKNIIFNGKVHVKNGQFEFTFNVPKDIDYNYGEGKILYYAYNSQQEAMGYTKVMIGGIYDTTLTDKRGPIIKLFLNDTTFVNGSITDRNPTVIAYLYDESGINTTTFGLGHELQMFVDDRQYFLNDYFTYDLDSYKSGKVKYSLYKLSPGPHTIKIIAFDVYNNYSEKSINFYVTDNQTFLLGQVFNYPNPFTNNTTFYFEHNQAGQQMYILLQIFSVSGRLIRTIESTMTPASYISEPIYWDGLDNFGRPIARGVYFYILTIKTPDGKQIKYNGKLLKI